MKRNVFSKLARRRDVCLLCASRQRPALRVRYLPINQYLRDYNIDAALRQSSAAAARVDDFDDDDDFAMLKRNAALSNPFPRKLQPQSFDPQPLPQKSSSDARGGKPEKSASSYKPHRTFDRSNRQGGKQETYNPVRSFGHRQQDFQARQQRQPKRRPEVNSNIPIPAASDAAASSVTASAQTQYRIRKFNVLDSQSQLRDRQQLQDTRQSHERERSHDRTSRKSLLSDEGTAVYNPLISARDEPSRSNRTGTFSRTSSIVSSAEDDLSGVQAPAGSSFDLETDIQRRQARKRERRDRYALEDDDADAVRPDKARMKGRKGRRSDTELAEDEALEFEDGRRNKGKRKDKRAQKSHSLRPHVQLPEFISVEQLARLLKVNIDQFITKLEDEGFEGARYDHILDASTSAMLAELYGFEPILGSSDIVKDLVARPPPENTSVLPPRPPIVTIMGHVDHGKTTILDYLRKTSVAAGEHGGITQHIGAFSVAMPGSNRNITFLDTPGHAAFLEMRRRGANVTDIVVLVVAADDSVKPQTIEAIKHAIEAKVHIIVAVNKIDKPEADVERVKQDLTRHDIVVEDYGGDYQVIPVSGKTGQGMAELEEAIVTLADVSDFRAEHDGPAEGWIIESKVMPGLGRVATVLVRRGTLRPGDCVVAGRTWAKIRSLRDDSGRMTLEASPGIPVQVDGWRGEEPDAGSEVLQAIDEDHAKEVIEIRCDQETSVQTAASMAAINATRSEEAEARAQVLAWEAEQEWSKKGYRARPKDNEGWVEPEARTDVKQLHFLIKADVAGSAEAVAHAVASVGTNEIAANVIHSGVGELTEFDVQRLAATGEKCFAISFNQTVDGTIRRLAAAADVEILDHNIIYKVTDDVKARLADELPPLVTQRVLGEAEIGQIFDITVKKNRIKIAGCKVTNGTINRSSRVRVLRAGNVVYTGTLNSLKNVKKDVTEMRKGTECGMGFDNWEDFQENDQIQCFEEHKEKRTLY